MKLSKHFIYIHQNKLNMKIYVGYSSNLNQRWQSTKSTAFNANATQHNEPFYKAIRRDGWENFTHEIIEEFDNKEEALESEIFWIEFFRSNRKKYGSEFGYNLHEGGNMPPINYGNKHNKGRILTKETKIKISKSHIGKPSGMRGKKHTKETKIKMSESSKNKTNIQFKNKTWKIIDGKRVWMEKK